MKTDKDSALKAVERAVNYGIFHQTDRNFANAKKIEFINPSFVASVPTVGENVAQKGRNDTD